MDDRELLRAAVAALGLRNFTLGIHDLALPGDPARDLGRGSLYSDASRGFLAFLASLGFDGVQLGPTGLTAPGDPSPYDGTIFSWNPCSLSAERLADDGWLRRETLDRLVASRPEGALDRVAHDHVHAVFRGILDEAWARHRASPERLGPRLARYRDQHEGWLVRDALYDVLCEAHGAGHHRDWPGPPGRLDARLWDVGADPDVLARRRALVARHDEAITRHALTQLLLADQHDALRADARALGLKLHGDLQVGLSIRDAWGYASLLLHGYSMGAPPSRTNPEGQPWGYPVLDPDRYQSADGAPWPGGGVGLLRARLDRIFAAFDGVRIDHPHGLVCPWVYRADAPDARAAVRSGARLFASPDLDDHPALARFALARPEQLARALPRHADGWVRALDAAQVDRYAALFDVVVEAARRRGRATEDLACEVLSTLPYPLARVIERHGLGRFRITQKADLADPADVYRSENARPEDWIMLGNHDTKSVWALAAEWSRAGTAGAQATYLAARLLPAARRDAAAARIAADPALLAQAKLADVLASPARNVMVFVADLLGETARYNAPGTVSADNWSLRVPSAYREDYARRRDAGEALDLPLAFALALRARGAGPAALADALAARAGRRGAALL